MSATDPPAIPAPSWYVVQVARRVDGRTVWSKERVRAVDLHRAFTLAVEAGPGDLLEVVATADEGR